MAIHAAAHRDIRLLVQPIPLLHFAMARFAARAGLEMVLVAEEHIGRYLVDPDPRDRLFARGETGQLLNCRPVLLHRLMASHAFRRGGNSHHFAGVRHFVATGALQSQRDVLFVAVGNRLNRRLGRENRRRHGEKSNTDQMFFFRISSAMYSAARIESARMVSVGFCEPPETNELPSTTNRFFTSWLWLYLLSTEVFGSAPMRQA